MRKQSRVKSNLSQFQETFQDCRAALRPLRKARNFKSNEQVANSREMQTKLVNRTVSRRREREKAEELGSENSRALGRGRARSKSIVLGKRQQDRKRKRKHMRKQNEITICLH
jgi:hypothetical protein